MIEQQPADMEAREKQAIAESEKKLASTKWLVERCQNTIAMVLNMASGKDTTPCAQIAINLLVRIWNELRAVLILCEHGYALQAFSPAAVIYEATFTVAAIGDSQEAATKWFNHSIEKRSFDTVIRLTEAGLANVLEGETKEHVATYYGVYRDLCMAKHVNPKVQQHEGHQIEPETKALNFAYGPDTSNESLKKAWWVMSWSVKLAYPALDTFITHFVAANEKRSAKQLLTELSNEHEKLNAELFAELKAAGLVPAS